MGKKKTQKKKLSTKDILELIFSGMVAAATLITAITNIFK